MRTLIAEDAALFWKCTHANNAAVGHSSFAVYPKCYVLALGDASPRLRFVVDLLLSRCACDGPWCGCASSGRRQSCGGRSAFDPRIFWPRGCRSCLHVPQLTCVCVRAYVRVRVCPFAVPVHACACSHASGTKALLRNATVMPARPSSDSRGASAPRASTKPVTSMSGATMLFSKVYLHQRDGRAGLGGGPAHRLSTISLRRRASVRGPTWTWVTT